MDSADIFRSNSNVSIGLGTVQLGLPYGNNAKGPIMPEHVAMSILKQAAESGVKFYDTAAAYGESEFRIGMSGILEDFDVTVSTKVPQVDRVVWSSETDYWDFLKKAVDSSRHKLRTKKLGLLQFHQCNLDFLESKVTSRLMERLIEHGLCERIGISVYEPVQAEASLEIPCLSCLQIPVNLVDTRFLKPDLLVRYQEKNAALIARSILLQGILVDHAPLPPVRQQKNLEILRNMLLTALASGQSLKELALRYIFINIRHILRIALIGVDSQEALQQNLGLISSLHQPVSHEQMGRFEEARAFAVQNELLTPATWN
jgi:aryl-alcohol dehydrogenase-like predicted oxidoreductase